MPRKACAASRHSTEYTMKHLLAALTLCLFLTGCSPSDQFWKKPDIGVKITSLAEALRNPGAVRYLSLYDNHLESFPQDILKLPNLERLSLRQNAIPILPDDISSLSKLNWLDAGRCQLTDLTPSIGKLTNLSFLYLNDNQLAALPIALGDCAKLQYLNADRNKLTALPTSLGALSSLKWLRLNNNQITALPRDLSGLASSLRRLYLKGNPIPDSEKERIRQALPKCEVIF